MSDSGSNKTEIYLIKYISLAKDLGEQSDPEILIPRHTGSEFEVLRGFSRPNGPEGIRDARS